MSLKPSSSGLSYRSLDHTVAVRRSLSTANRYPSPPWLLPSTWSRRVTLGTSPRGWGCLYVRYSAAGCTVHGHVDLEARGWLPYLLGIPTGTVNPGRPAVSLPESNSEKKQFAIPVEILVSRSKPFGSANCLFTACLPHASSRTTLCVWKKSRISRDLLRRQGLRPESANREQPLGLTPHFPSSRL